MGRFNFESEKQMMSRAIRFFVLLLVINLTPIPSQSVSVSVSFTEQLGPLDINKISLGQGGLSEEPMWQDRAAEIRALQPRLIRLFIQEYFDLLPSRGQYHFDTLDQSIDLILKTGAKPLMCICFKPRVLFPEINQDIVEPNDYEEWEKLIFHLVRHYRERGAGIQHWEVANEPDIGEDGGCPYRFKPESYIRYYQHTAAAILRADPTAKVGGPALANSQSPILPALLDFCETNPTPLHFVSWHIYSSEPAAIRATIDYVHALLKKHPALHPETILDEWNMSLGNPSQNPNFQPCFIAETAWQMKEAGLDYSCYYHIRDYHVSFARFGQFMSPHGNAFMAQWWNRMAQYDGLFDYQNTIRPAYFTFKLLSRLAGVRLRLNSDHSAVHGFFAYDEIFQLYNLMLWNFSDNPVNVDITCDRMPSSMLVKPIMLEAETTSSDENLRLRPEKSFTLTPDLAHIPVALNPYAVRFWSFAVIK